MFGLSLDEALGAQILSQFQNLGGLGSGLPGMGQGMQGIGQGMQQAPMQGVENLVSAGLRGQDYSNGIVEGEWGPDSPAGKEGFMGWLQSEKGQEFLSSLQGMQQPQQQQQMPQFGPIGSGQFAAAGNPLAPRQPISWRG